MGVGGEDGDVRDGRPDCGVMGGTRAAAGAGRAGTTAGVPATYVRRRGRAWEGVKNRGR